MRYERLIAIQAEFQRRGCDLTIQPSARGEARGGWLARYSCREPRLDGIAHGNTELEAAELALVEVRSRCTADPPAAGQA